MNHTPILLCILDGWGITKDSPNNAISQANPRFYNHLLQTTPFSCLETSGKAVGLPDGQMGNSEVGHMTIGSGRIALQDLPRITKSLRDDKFFEENKSFKKIISEHQNKKNVCHIIGLFSEGGVHSHSSHAIKIIRYLLKNDIKVCLHIICDGRDTKPKIIIQDLKKLEEFAENELFNITTISGRFYAMDRDNRLERTTSSFNSIVRASGKKFENHYQAITDSYAKSITDEFIEPTTNKMYQGFKDGDSVIFYNFRPDRMRQLTDAIIDNSNIPLSNKLIMTPYSKEIADKCEVLFPKAEIPNTLGEIISKQNFFQMRIAETEKYPHVTYFFNGGREKEFPREKRVLVPSPKIETYDLKPEMSAHEITNTLISSATDYEFLIVNFANTDMVGHTGNFEATKEAVKVIDNSIKRLSEKFVDECNGIMIITADHGNAEEMFDDNNQPITSHSTNPVPFILVSKKYNKNNTSLENGYLYDIAPTILKLLDIDAPQDMIGKNLITNLDEKN